MKRTVDIFTIQIKDLTAEAQERLFKAAGVKSEEEISIDSNVAYIDLERMEMELEMQSEEYWHITFDKNINDWSDDDEMEDCNYSFSEDLRPVFHCESNYDAQEIIQEHIKAPVKFFDTEYSCLYAYFDTEKEARTWIDEYNKLLSKVLAGDIKTTKG